MLEEVAARLISRLTEVSIDSGDAKATITIVDFSALALDTVTVTIGGTAHVLTEGTDWNRGASNTAAATSLAAAIDALTRVSASSSAAVVTITAPENITSLAVSDAVNMTLVDSSLTTLYDPEKNYEVNKWEEAIIEVEVDGVHYYRTCASNTLNILTIGTLPVGHPVTPGAHYNIRLSSRVVKISGQVVHISGQAVKISGETVIAKVSGQVVQISGQVVQVSGQAVKVSGQTITQASGAVVLVSGQTITQASGAVVIAKISGEVVKISGEVVQVSGQAVKVSGQTIIQASGAVVLISGQTVIAKISGEVVDIMSPTEVKTGLIKPVTDVSGGEVLHSGAVKAAQVKSLATNSGVILIGGATNRPWYEDTCSGLGFVLDAGEVKSEDIDNFNRIYVVAQVSGDQVSFLGVN